MKGYKTSEFWMALIVTAMFFLLYFQDKSNVVLAGAIVVPSVYIYARVSVKKADSNSKKIDGITVRK